MNIGHWILWEFFLGGGGCLTSNYIQFTIQSEGIILRIKPVLNY